MADAQALDMGAAVVGIWHAAIFEPATRWRRWWLDVTRAIIIDERAADEATDHTCGQTTSDSGTIVSVMPARWVAVWRWRRAAAIIIPVWPVIKLLCRSGIDSAQKAASGNQSGQDRQNDLLHSGLLRVSRT